MTSATLLSKVRTLLDESSASYWSDNEIYAALAAGQKALISEFIKLWRQGGNAKLPNVLRIITKNKANSSLTTQTDSIPSDYIDNGALGVRFSYNSTSASSRVACRIRTLANRSFKSGNTYLASSSADPYCYFDGSNINFETTVSGTGSYDYDYLYMPADIASGQNPTLPENCMDALCIYALAMLLKKDERENDSAANMELFMQLIPGLLV